MMFRYFSLVLSLAFTLSSAVYAGGAGVLPMFDDGTVLIGKEKRGNGFMWSDFGGKQDPNEPLHKTAHREFQEETARYSFPSVSLNQVANAPYSDHNHALGSYRLYFVPVHGQKPSIQTIVQNARKAKQRHGHNAHVEKVEWKYVSAQQIKNAPWQNGQIPGIQDPIFGAMIGALKKPAAQTALANFINTTNNNPVPQPQKPAPKHKKPAPKHKKQPAPKHKKHAPKHKKKPAPKHKKKAPRRKR